MNSRIYIDRGYNHPHVYIETYKHEGVSLYSESFTAGFKSSDEVVEIENLKGKVVLKLPSDIKLVARAIRDLEIELNTY